MGIVIDLPMIWAFVIAFTVFAYVAMDGFDLGLGMLFPFFPKRDDRNVMMNSVAPVWDGNETWLVLGGGGLLAAFPLAYSDADAGAVHADDRHAARARAARRGVRIPLAVDRAS